MTVEEAKEKLANFASKDKTRRTICRVRTKGNFAYATDGRIAFRAEMDVPDKDDCEEFPVKAIDEFAGIVLGHSDWRTIDSEAFNEMCEGFNKALTDYIKEQEADIRDRYIRKECPCCRADVYWDRDNQELVELENIDEVDSSPGHVDYPVRIVFGENWEIPVNLGYLYLVKKAFGDDVVFAAEVVEKSGISRLVMKTIDGKSTGVLMPLRVVGDEKSTDRVLEAKKC